MISVLLMILWWVPVWPTTWENSWSSNQVIGLVNSTAGKISMNVWESLTLFHYQTICPLLKISRTKYHNHSSYSFLSSTVSGPSNVITDVSQQPSLLSTIPMIGPLNISLNSREHLVKTFHPFFKSIYETIFPKTKLPANPKPWRVSLILEMYMGNGH